MSAAWYHYILHYLLYLYACGCLVEYMFEGIALALLLRDDASTPVFGPATLVCVYLYVCIYVVYIIY